MPMSLLAIQALVGVLSVASVGAISVIGWSLVQRARQPKHDEAPASEDIDDITLANSSTTLTLIKEEHPELVRRREFIRTMAREAWDAHCAYAWGQDTLLPCAKEAFNFWFGPCSGHTMIMAMSTLWVMGYTEDFHRAKQWLDNRFNFEKVKLQWNVLETITDYVGSLLSCYALSGEKVFLDQATMIAKALEPAFETPTGIPYPLINPKTGIYKYLPTTSLSEACAGMLEYPLLSDLTADPSHRDRVKRIRDLLRSKSTTRDCLYMKSINLETGEWAVNKAGTRSTLFKSQRAYFTSLLKCFVQTAGHDVEAIELYAKSLDSVERHAMFATSRTGLVYARSYDTVAQTHDDYTEYSGCYLGAMLSMGASVMEKRLRAELKSKKAAKPFEEQEVERDRIYRHRKLARDLTDTFHTAAAKTMTGLPPWRMYFNAKDEATNSKTEFSGFNLSPELAESYFILWRLTHDTKYRDYAWQLAEAIYEHCRTESGYSELDSTSWVPTERIHIQPAAFLGATLKYLYLTFCDDSVLPLDKWVFNGAGQPLPIRGNYKMARKGLCSVS